MSSVTAAVSACASAVPSSLVEGFSVVPSVAETRYSRFSYLECGLSGIGYVPSGMPAVATAPSPAKVTSATVGSASAPSERVVSSKLLMASTDTGALTSSAIARVVLTVVRCRVDA